MRSRDLAVATKALKENGVLESVHQPKRLLRFPRVFDRVGYSHSQLYLLIKRGEFPKPVSLGGRAVAWRESDIDAWIESRKEA
jgi:prophage regulatory protein